MPSFAAQIKAGRGILVGNLDAKRDFLHVEDVVDAYVKLIDVAPQLSKRSLFNLASGKVSSVGFLLNRMMELSGTQAKVQVDPNRLRPSDVPVAAVDASLVREKIAWAPQRSLDDMLSDLIK